MLPKQPVSLSLPPPAAIFSLSLFCFWCRSVTRSGFRCSFISLFFNFLQRRRSPESASAVSRVPIVCGDVHSVLWSNQLRSEKAEFSCIGAAVWKRKKERKESHLFKQWWIIIIFRFYFLFFLISQFNDVKLFYKNQMKCNKDNYYRKDIPKVIALQWEDF